MKNFLQFFHFHHGDKYDQIVKILGSFIVAIALGVLSVSLSASSALDERSYILSMLVPELAIVEAGENDAEIAMEVAPVQAEAVPASQPTSNQPCSIDGKPVPCVQPPSMDSSPQTSAPPESRTCWMNEKQVSCEEMEKDQERMNKQNIMEQRKHTLEDIRNQKRELKSVCNQLKRLKGAENDAVACNDLLLKLTSIEQQLKSSSGDVEDLQEIMNEFRDMQTWDDINKMRLRANLPRELNQFFKDLVRVERMLKQKTFQRIVGLNFDQINAKFNEIKQAHADAKACYESGDFECANEKLNEARQETYPGELESSLHMLRSINDMLRNIRDKELQAEIQQLLAPSIEQLNAGEWRDARQDIGSMQRELMQVLEQIMRAQQRRSGLPKDIMNRLERLTEKYGGADGEEKDFNGGPPQGFPAMKQF